MFLAAALLFDGGSGGVFGGGVFRSCGGGRWAGTCSWRTWPLWKPKSSNALPLRGFLRARTTVGHTIFGRGKYRSEEVPRVLPKAMDAASHAFGRQPALLARTVLPAHVDRPRDPASLQVGARKSPGTSTWSKRDSATLSQKISTAMISISWLQVLFVGVSPRPCALVTRCTASVIANWLSSPEVDLAALALALCAASGPKNRDPHSTQNLRGPPVLVLWRWSEPQLQPPRHQVGPRCFYRPRPQGASLLFPGGCARTRDTHDRRLIQREFEFIMV